MNTVPEQSNEEGPVDVPLPKKNWHTLLRGFFDHYRAIWSKNSNTKTICVSFTEDGFCIVSLYYKKNETIPTLEKIECHPRPEGTEYSEFFSDILDQFTPRGARIIGILDDKDYALISSNTLDVQPEEMRNALRWEMQDRVEFSVETAVIDYFEGWKKQGDVNKKSIEVVVAKGEAMELYTGLFHDAKVKPNIIDIPELALCNLLKMLQLDPEPSSLIFRIKKQNSTLIVAHDGVMLMTRRTSIGFEALSDNNDFIIDDLLNFIQKSIDYYERYIDGPKLGYLIGLPVEQAIGDAYMIMAERIGLSLRTFDLNDLLQCNQQLESNMQAKSLEAVGGALRETG
ncbi:MAG: hypothetical protein HQL93_14185 [Magnetococcales bacterium]|nr:hypothetical protein [Magnetococcales bacterium]